MSTPLHYRRRSPSSLILRDQNDRDHWMVQLYIVRNQQVDCTSFYYRPQHVKPTTTNKMSQDFKLCWKQIVVGQTRHSVRDSNQCMYINTTLCTKSVVLTLIDFQRDLYPLRWWCYRGGGWFHV